MPPSQACHPQMGQTEKKIPLLVAVLAIFILIFLIPEIQEIVHWFLHVGVRVRVSKYDVDYCVIMAFP